LAFFLGYYACCNGDTWASEIGVLSTSQPFLITNPLKRVPTGTNGGISILGTVASIIGGTFIGIVFWVAGIFFCNNPVDSTIPPQWPIILLGTLGGTLGSIIDSYLGATLQYSGYSPVLKKVVNKPIAAAKKITGSDILNNHQVNLLSALITGFIVTGTAKILF